MTTVKAFTLIEVLIVLIIIGVALSFTIPSFLTSAEQSRAQSAKNNLMAIDAGQAKYYEDHNGYYTGNGYGTLSSALSLGLAQDTFTYSCTASGSSYSCTAHDTALTLTLNPSASPIVTCSANGGYSGGNCPADSY